MNIGSLNYFLDIEGKTYEKKITTKRSVSNPNPIERQQQIIQQSKTPLKFDREILKNNIQRFKSQLQDVYNHRTKKSTPKSMVVEKPQSVKRHQLTSIPMKSPNYLGLFDKNKVYGDVLHTQTLKQKHHLLRTVNDVKLEENKNKMSSLIDQAYLRMQSELNNQSQIRSQERQSYLQQYELYNKVPINQQNLKDVHEPNENNESEQSSQEELNQTTRRLKQKKNNTTIQKCDDKKLILRFPQYRWSKIRNLSYHTPQECRLQKEEFELNSSKFMEQIIETGRNKRQATDVIDKLEKIVNQIFE